jgi:hypothetical protein
LSRQALIDTAVARVFSNENMRKAFQRYRILTPSMAEQVLAQYRVLDLEAQRPGP